MAATSERVSRLLSLVPYLLSRPGVAIADVAADFAVSERQLRRDLELLWMCGLPGYGPGDLIDLSFGVDSVTVTYDAGMRRPLRLTTREATSLLVALHALAETPGVVDSDAVRRALAKLESAVGLARPDEVVVGLEREPAVDAGVSQAIREALERSCALRIRYYTASRDEITSRVVDPIRLVLVEGREYLEAWCRRAEATRLFRLDRVDAAVVTDEPACPGSDALTDFSAGLFPPGEGQREAVLVLDAEARWVAEYYVVDELSELSGGRIRVWMRYADSAWMVRLVLGLGGRAVLESPAELAYEVRRRADVGLARARHLPST